ncbi:MAG: hypothetical protein U0T81_14270 [Saprospiraceae bacterium]
MPEFRYTVLVILFSLPTIYSICQNVISINLTDSLSGEPVIGAIIKCTLTSEGAISDANGIFSVPASWKLPENALTIQHNEYTVKKIDLSLLPDSGIFNIQLLPIDHELEEVTVYSERTNSRIADLPVKVEVIGNDETSEENLIKPANILSLLGDIAGIQLQQLSALSGNMLPRIQGLNGRYTLFVQWYPAIGWNCSRNQPIADSAFGSEANRNYQRLPLSPIRSGCTRRGYKLYL